jgi:hypothetical protein
MLLFGRYYNRLRSDLLILAFKNDTVMKEASEDAFTAFLDSPLKFGMICTEARAEAWRLTSYWLVMLAGHIDAIIRNPGATSKDDISDALNLAVLLSDKLVFATKLAWPLTGRLLNPVAGFANVCIELEHFVVHGLLARGYHQSLMDPIQNILDDYIVHELPGGRVVLRGKEGDGGGGGGGGGGRGHELDPHPQTDLVPCEIRYLSKSVWQSYCERVFVR